MLSSIATVSVSGLLDAKLRAIAKAGFAGVEIFENDLLSHTASPRQVGAMLRDLGLVCTVFQPFRDFEGMPADLRQRVFDRIERKFDVMHELGTDLILVCSNVSPAALADRARIVDDFRELGERAAARGLRVGYEALAWGRHVWDHRDAWAVVKAVNHPAIGLILDSFHSLARAVPTDSLHWIDAEKIFIVQIADAPALSMDPLSWSRHFRCMPGQGDLPLVEYVSTMAGIGYRGPLSLEIFNDRFRAGDTNTVAMDGWRSLQYLQDQVHKRVVLPDVLPLPPRVGCKGVEFIELCASEDEVASLEQLLRSLGFSLVGRHRSKAVTHWRQGESHFVVNSETEGFAHSYSQVHGASINAIGLKIDSVQAAVQRAVGLGIGTYTQAVGPGEMRIPAIQAVGGSLIYLVAPDVAEQMWAVDFMNVEESTVNVGAGIVRVDHLTQAMQYEEMLSWLLYYVSLFDVDKAPQVEIADPVGLVLSQAVHSRDGRFRITLNGSAAAHTQASRFLHNYLGAGVQHIALQCDDIFSTATRLAELQLEFLPIPENYYDDVAVRFGLDTELIARMARHHIMYDRDEEGEFFQFYSTAFAKRFFFEIVQRRGYNAYGAINAPIRIAAQSRYPHGVAP